MTLVSFPASLVLTLENALGGFAIRAAKFGPIADSAFRAAKKNTRESQHREKRGAFEGPIRISLHSLLCLFNALALPSISSKSLKFQSVLFSIPTAPTNYPLIPLPLLARTL